MIQTSALTCRLSSTSHSERLLALISLGAICLYVSVCVGKCLCVCAHTHVAKSVCVCVFSLRGVFPVLVQIVMLTVFV